MLVPLRNRPMSVDDLYELPDAGFLYELQAGMLVSEPSPGSLHGRVTAAVTELLRSHVRRLGLGIVVAADFGFILARNPDTLRGPDVAFISKRRAQEHGDSARAFDGAPDLAVEVLSPSNTPEGIRAKVAEYLAAGTRSVWVIDSGLRGVTVYADLLSPRVLGEGDFLEGSEVVTDFRVRVGEFFED